MQWYFYVITLIIICNILGLYENGIEKVKLAEQFSDIDNCTDSETSKKLRQKHAKRRYNIDSDDEIDSNDETLSSLPPPPNQKCQHLRINIQQNAPKVNLPMNVITHPRF